MRAYHRLESSNRACRHSRYPAAMTAPAPSLLFSLRCMAVVVVTGVCRRRLSCLSAVSYDSRPTVNMILRLFHRRYRRRLEPHRHSRA